MVKFPRHAALAGILAALLFGASVFSLGQPPVASDTPAEMASSLASGRDAFVVGVFGAGLGLMFGIWFLSVLRSWLRATMPEGGEELATATFAGGLFTMMLALLGVLFFYGATYDLAGYGGSGALQALVDAANAALMLSKFAWAVVVVALSVAGSRSAYFPRWFIVLGYISAFVLVASSTGVFTEDTFTEFGGPLDLGGTAPAGVWSLLMMVLLVRAGNSPSAPRQASDPPSQ